jgi:hypothetical protein
VGAGLRVPAIGRYSGYIDIKRLISLALLAVAIAVPALTSVHQQLSDGRNPAREHSRFRWTDSCDAVPKKAMPPAVVLVRPQAGAVFVEALDRFYVPRLTEAAPPEPLVAPTRSLRSPPFPVL